MINNFKNLWSKHQINIIIFLLAFILFVVNFYDLHYKMLSNNTADKQYYLLFIFISIILYSIIIFLNKKMSNKLDSKIHKVFLLTALILGIIFIILSPLFTGSDEHNHYFRIYEITEGVFVTPTNGLVGSELPEALKKTFETASGDNTKIKYKAIKAMQDIKLNKSNVTQYGDLYTNSYSNTALYSPIQYLPHTIGFIIAKALNFSPFIIGIFGRTFNLIFYILIGYLSLKIIPKSKLFYLLILISPNMLQCATTLSADAFTNIVFLLILALILNFRSREKKLSRIEEILLFFLCIIISLCKIVYLPIVFLLLLIDKNHFIKENKEKLIFIIITIISSALVSLLWMSFTEGVFAITYDKTALQKQFIFNNIFEYVIILIRTFANYIIKYIECLFVGTTMYHSQLKIPILISFIYILIEALALLKENQNCKFNILQKIFILLIGLSIVVLISTAIYIQCTAQYFSVGNSTIEGIQGRYFIPVIFLIPFVFKSTNKKINIDSNTLYKSSLYINLITWFYMLCQFMV